MECDFSAFDVYSVRLQAVEHLEFLGEETAWKNWRFSAIAGRARDSRPLETL
jgi:hypothetical protein